MVPQATTQTSHVPTSAHHNPCRPSCPQSPQLHSHTFATTLVMHSAVTDSSEVSLLDVGMIWGAVRSGDWYPGQCQVSGTPNKQLDDGFLANIRDATVSVVARLDELGRKSAPQVAGDVALAALAAYPTRTYVNAYSIQQLSCILASLQSLSSPWRKLPDELLIEVFSRCICSDAVFSTSQAPILLTTICSRWHTLCINTPALWTSLTLTQNFLINGEARLDAATEFEETWREDHKLGLGRGGAEFMSMVLHRSRNLPISLCSHSGILLSPFTQQLYYAHFYRFKNLTLLIPEPDGNCSPFPNVEQTFVAPHLESLNIYALGVSRQTTCRKASWAAPYVQLIQSASSTIRHLNFIAFCCPKKPQIDFDRRWERLTHVTWRPEISEYQVVSLFRNAPNLHYASFPEIASRQYDDLSKTTPPEKPIILAKLDTLVVGVRVPDLFSAVTAPNLRHFVHLSPSNVDKDAFISFLRRSACPLETLYLYYAMYNTPRDLLDVLESVECCVGSSGSNHKGVVKGRGHLKAFLVTDGHIRRSLQSNDIIDRLTSKAEPPQSTADVRESLTTASAGDLNHLQTQEHHDIKEENNVLFPGLEYLSIYDIGPAYSEKILAMLRSRTSFLPVASVSVPGETLKVNETGQASTSTLTPVSKLKMFETWDRCTGLNDISDADWNEVEKLRENGLVLRLFGSGGKGPYLTGEERVLLKKYVDGGLCVRDYLHDIGYMAPISVSEATDLANAETTVRK